MSRVSHKLLCVVSAGLVAALGCALIAHAADPVKPDIRPGLWEVSNHPQVSGQMPLPEERLAKMPPEQRAKVEAAMQAGMAQAVRPRVYKECMTPEKIARGFDIDKHGDSASCQRKVINSSATELQIHEDCTRPDGKTSIDVHFQVAGRVQMTGKITAVMTAGSRTMTMNSTVEGKWIGASCGTVKDAEVEK